MIKKILSKKIFLASLIFVVLISLTALFADWIAPYSYDFQDTKALLQGPSVKHWFGTDRLGRDLFSRILYGAQVSLSVALISSLIAVLFGSLYGAVAGFSGGRVDSVLMRIVDVIYCIPDLLVIILISIMIGRGIGGIVISLSLVSWVNVARIMRGEFLRVKHQEFVEAAEMVGAGRMRKIFIHILPQTLNALLVTATFRIPQVILAESSLSFLGLGIAPPFSSWGTLANEGWSSLSFYPYLILFPSAAIFLTILAFNILGENLRDILDPYFSE